MTVSIIVPCYNEEAAIFLFYEKVIEVFSEHMETHENISLEFIFVDDGSVDSTFTVLKNLAAKDSRVRYIIFSRNFGKESALLAGLQKARGQYIVTMDADLQDPPALIPSMFKAVDSGGFDCAGSRRVTRKGEPPIRSFFARCFYSLMKKISDIEIVDNARDFRLMNRTYLNSILSLDERNRFSKGIFPWIGFRVKWFEYENIQRIAGETKWSFWRLFLYSLDGIIAFSSKPLALASLFGISMFTISFIFIVLIIIRKITFGDPVDGWASTVCIVLFCSGIHLFTTGILGQYLAKTYTEVKRRPHYLIREEI
jgi:glycosyltransferase involved in cell wall biosynthesis